MIVSVRGSLAAVGPDWVHLQLGGVTLQVFVPSSAIAQLGDIGATVSLHTHLRMRDEQPVLYGFPSPAALELFLMLTAVSGVGPRLALGLLSTLDAAGLQQAISAGDIPALSATPGVGRRTAGRIVLELKGKLEQSLAETPAMAASTDTEVVEALMALGYSASESRRAVSDGRNSAGLSVEERIRLALQTFGPG